MLHVSVGDLSGGSVDLEALRRLGHHCNHGFYGGTTWLVALELANGDGHIVGQVQYVLSPGFELANVLGLGSGSFLVE